MKVDNQIWKKGVRLAILGAFCYGTLPIFSQMAYRTGIPVSTLLTGRYAMAVLLYFLYLTATKKTVKIPAKQRNFLLLVGVLCASANLSANQSFRLLPGAVSSIIAMTFIVYVIILEVLASKKKAAGEQLLCLAMCFSGLVIITWTPSGPSQLSLFGIAMGCLGAVLDAFQILAISRPLIRDLSLAVILFYISIPVALISALISLVSGNPIIVTDGPSLLYMLILAFLNSFLARLAFYSSARLIGAGNASLIDTVEPLIAAATGILLLGDSLSLKVVAGSGLILAGNIYLNWKQTRAKEQEKSSATVSPVASALEQLTDKLAE